MSTTPAQAAVDGNQQYDTPKEKRKRTRQEDETQGESIQSPPIVDVDSRNISDVVFRVRVIELDHYMSKPLEHADILYSLFSHQPIRELPIIRVWGRTPGGQSACCHVHGVFPYLYVDLAEAAWDTAMEIEQQERAGNEAIHSSSTPSSDPTTELSIFLSRFGACVERALRELQQLDYENRRANSEDQKDEADNRPAGGGGGGGGETTHRMNQQRGGSGGGNRKGTNKPYIHSMCVVRAKSIFGYAPTEKPYIKLSLYDPVHIRRVGSILQSGCILGHSFEVYESHIPFHLQFMADCNLSGMDFMDLDAKMEFRQPIPKTEKRMTHQVTTCNSENQLHGRRYVANDSSSSSFAPRISIAYESPATDGRIDDSTRFDRPLELQVSSGASRLWTTSSTPAYLLASIRRTKVTHCQLELDCTIESILNGHRIQRIPLSQTKEEVKLVQSLAGLWKNERDRRKEFVRKTTQKLNDPSQSFDSQVSSNSSNHPPPSIPPITPLTPPITPIRSERIETNLDRAYQYQIRKVIQQDLKWKEKKMRKDMSDGEQVEHVPVAESVQAQSPLQPSAAVASSSSSIDDLDALLREADGDSAAGVDAPATPGGSMLVSAIRDARTAVERMANVTNHTTTDTLPPPPTPSAAAQPSGPMLGIDVSTLPSAFELSQRSIPVVPIPSSNHPSQHSDHLYSGGVVGGSVGSPASQVQSSQQRPTSFFFSQHSTTPAAPFAHSPAPRHTTPMHARRAYSPSMPPPPPQPHRSTLTPQSYHSPSLLSQTHQSLLHSQSPIPFYSPPSLEQRSLPLVPPFSSSSSIAFGFGSQQQQSHPPPHLTHDSDQHRPVSTPYATLLPEDAITIEFDDTINHDDDSKEQTRPSGNNENQSQQQRVSLSQSRTMTLWLNSQLLQMSQIHENNNDDIDEKKNSQSNTIDRDDNDGEDGVSDEEDDEARDPSDEQHDIMMHSQVDPDLEALYNADDDDADVRDDDGDGGGIDDVADEAAAGPTRVDDLGAILALPLASTVVAASSDHRRHDRDDDDVVIDSIPQFDGADDDPIIEDRNDMNRVPKHRLVVKSTALPSRSTPIASDSTRRPAAATAATIPTSVERPPPPPTSASLHFERILEHRILPSSHGQGGSHEQYKVQLCYSDGTLVPENQGGVKWFSVHRLMKRPELIQRWRQRVKRNEMMQHANTTSTHTTGAVDITSRKSGANINIQPMQTITNATTPATVAAAALVPPASVPTPAALVMQARTNHRLHRSPVAASAAASTASSLVADHHPRHRSPAVRHTVSFGSRSSTALDLKHTPPMLRSAQKKDRSSKITLVEQMPKESIDMCHTPSKTNVPSNDATNPISHPSFQTLMTDSVDQPNNTSSNMIESSTTHSSSSSAKRVSPSNHTPIHHTSIQHDELILPDTPVSTETNRYIEDHDMDEVHIPPSDDDEEGDEEYLISQSSSSNSAPLELVFTHDDDDDGADVDGGDGASMSSLHLSLDIESSSSHNDMVIEMDDAHASTHMQHSHARSEPTDTPMTEGRMGQSNDGPTTTTTAQPIQQPPTTMTTIQSSTGTFDPVRTPVNMLMLHATPASRDAPSSSSSPSLMITPPTAVMVDSVPKQVAPPPRPFRHPIFELANMHVDREQNQIDQTSSIPIVSIPGAGDISNEPHGSLPPPDQRLSLSLPITSPPNTIQPEKETDASVRDVTHPIERDVISSSNTLPSVDKVSDPPPLPPPSRRVLTNLYAHDTPFDPSHALRFDSIDLPGSQTRLHILRTQPPTLDELLNTCFEDGGGRRWSRMKMKVPFYSNHQHWRQHVAALNRNPHGTSATSSTIGVHAYVQRALGEFGKGVVPTGIHPPPDLIEALPEALPTVKLSTPIMSRPTFASFHGTASFDHYKIPSSSRPIFLPTVPPPSVHTLGRIGTIRHVWQYAMAPPTIQQLANASKNWKKEITGWEKSKKKKTKRQDKSEKRTARRDGGVAGVDSDVDADANAPNDDDSDSSASFDRDKGLNSPEPSSSDLPRAASPKHDESCQLSYSYFQKNRITPSTTAKKKKRNNHPDTGRPSPSVHRPPPTTPSSVGHVAGHATQQTPIGGVNLLSDRKRRRFMMMTPSQTGASIPLAQPEPNVKAVEDVDVGDTPNKLPRLSSTSRSPHLSSSTLSASVSDLPTTLASRGLRTQEKEDGSQLEGPSTVDQTPIRYNQNEKDNVGRDNIDVAQQQHLTIMSIEVFACSRGQLLPDPRHDSVSAIVYTVRSQVHGEHEHQPDLKGVLLCPHIHEVACPDETPKATMPNMTGTDGHPSAPSAQPPSPPPRSCSQCSPHCSLPFLSFDSNVLVQTFLTESDLLDSFIELIVQRIDPDIILGFEIQKGSLGYLVERSYWLKRKPMQQQLSRIVAVEDQVTEKEKEKQQQQNGFRGAERDRSNPASAYAWSHGSGLTIPGRILLNLWRLLRDELKLTSYTFENVVQHLLGRNYPSFPPYVKTRWFHSTLVASGEGGCSETLSKQEAHRTNTLPKPCRPTSYSGNGIFRVLNDVLERTKMNIEILDQLDLIGRTSELARVFGIKFYSVLDRGTQYRVESMLLRLSKPQNYLLLSISPLQRSNQPAMECLPLIMEPISNFYTDPVVVLDFQSLYPSMMIAYNICYSTCLGRVPKERRQATTSDAQQQPQQHATTPIQQRHTNENVGQSTMNLHPSQSSPLSQSQASAASLSQGDDGLVHRLPPPPPPPPRSSLSASHPSTSSPSPADLYSTPPSHDKLGGTVIPRSSSILNDLLTNDSMWISSNGIMFTTKECKQGLLPRLLKEILETRIMVKQSMKRSEVESHRGLHRLFNARQFGLKLISNVTYGYTSAGFSGRMPCAEIADSIVQSGRDTLERAIRLVNSDPHWHAKVVYGDTDSLFVLLPGRTKDEAFKIGAEIAQRVTSSNPKPIKLQMDKVYQPCCLLSKKRYVGYKYEKSTQLKPILEAKGIETVRRDGCPAVVKTMESVIRILFETRDLSLIRTYLERQWSKIWSGRYSLKDFIFAKEVKLGNYKQPPLAAILAQRLVAQDPRSGALYGERIPYVIVDGPPQSRLIDRLQHPISLILRPDLYRLCASYYIEIIINRPLMRILNLVGVDLAQWYGSWSRPRRQTLATPIEQIRKSITTNVRNETNSMIQSANQSSAQQSISSRRSTTGPSSSSTTRRGRRVGAGHGLPTPGPARREYDLSGPITYSMRRTIDQYYVSQHCASCDQLCTDVFCDACQARTHGSTRSSSGDIALAGRGSHLRFEWTEKLHSSEKSFECAMSLCRSCIGDGRSFGFGGGSRELVDGTIPIGSGHAINLAYSVPHIGIPCISLDCENQFQRQIRFQQMKQIRETMKHIHK